MPGTVKFREAIKQDDGTYKPGDIKRREGVSKGHG